MRGVVYLLQLVLAADAGRDEVRPDGNTPGANPSLDTIKAKYSARLESLKRVYLGKYVLNKDNKVEVLPRGKDELRNAVANVFGKMMVGSTIAENKKNEEQAKGAVMDALEQLGKINQSEEIKSEVLAGRVVHIFTEPGNIIVGGMRHWILTQEDYDDNKDKSKTNQLSASFDNISLSTRPKRTLAGMIIHPHRNLTQFVKVDDILFKEALMNYFGRELGSSTSALTGEGSTISSEELGIFTAELDIAAPFSDEVLGVGDYLPLYTEPGCTITEGKGHIPNFKPYGATPSNASGSGSSSLKEICDEVLQSLQQALNSSE
ncbi:hypothetical protein ENBRE01_2531 [Enteropsectra breve]|nr:hypothetical protein ENBRE01_2531 [Enteropsectra breve]